jgi:LacI family repressor for deo operon, udp, cdd, tsx, nupC, and nupG
MFEAGLEINPKHLFEGDFTIWSGQSAALTFSQMDNRPTAISCMNDEMAIGAIQTFKGQGLRVPEDISIAGFDDINYAKFWDPGLTTVAQPAAEIGKKAAEMLISMIESGDLRGQELILPTEFIIRQSTGKPLKR